MRTLFKGGTVVDGSGAPRRVADVLIAGDEIVAVGDLGGVSDAETIDARGLVVSPGFIDIHTHYDAQVLWDADLTSSSWHGVTTVVMGNCGFSIAPTRREHRGIICRTLENVEDMPLAALEAGIPWGFESFPEYLDVLAARPKRLNVAAMVGHSALRLYVMGEDAVERSASPDEVQMMRTVLAGAIRAGGIGFATSRSASHIGADGRPVPSRLAAPDEVVALASVLDDVGRGAIQIAPGGALDEVAMLARETSRPITWSALLTGRYAPRAATDLVDETASWREGVWPQISCRPLVMQLSPAEPRALAGLSAFQSILAADPERRIDLYRDSRWRDEATSQLETAWVDRWARMSIDESSAHPDLVGRRIAEVAEARGDSPATVFLDVAVDDRLASRFGMILLNDDEEELGRLLRDRRTLVGLSDAGAHSTQLCDACYSSHLLGHWVRDRQDLDLETAVWRLTGQPASIFGIAGRGLLRERYAADVVLFDPTTVAPLPPQRVKDMPGGIERLTAMARGIAAVYVNGTKILDDGRLVGDARPGMLLRS
jgi:N-acyl-D-aspartate/D-glutamate deacylase